MTETAVDRAKFIASRLWTAICFGGWSSDPIHVPALFSRQYATGLPRAWAEGHSGYSVALVDWPEFERFSDKQSAEAAVATRPRTRIFESVHRLDGQWQAICANLLAQISGVEVIASAYESTSKDAALPEHEDAWFNAALQLSGEKRWHFGGDVLVMSPGDLLLVPVGCPHEAVVDGDWSCHIGFGLVEPSRVVAYKQITTSSPPT